MNHVADRRLQHRQTGVTPDENCRLLLNNLICTLRSADQLRVGRPPASRSHSTLAAARAHTHTHTHDGGGGGVTYIIRSCTSYCELLWPPAAPGRARSGTQTLQQRGATVNNTTKGGGRAQRQWTDR